MKAELVDVNETRRNLVVEIPSEVVDAEIARVSASYGRAAQLPGFRPGKVPVKVVRQRFLNQILHDVARTLVERAVEDVLTERGVEPVGTPDIRDVVVEAGRPLTFKAEFDIVPVFDPGDLSTIAVRRSLTPVDDAAVEEALQQLRERAARYEPADGGVVDDGHTLLVDLERQAFDKSGQPGQQDKHEGIPVEIGARSNPPGFDAELKGLAAGSSKAFRLRYGDDYSVPELAGTEVAYTVHVHEIRRRVVPALDDELAKDLGEFGTLDALRDRVRTDLEAAAQDAADRQVRTDVLKQLAARVPFSVPSTLVDHEVDRRVEQFARRLREQRIDPRQANIDWAAFRESQRAAATDAVASAIVLDEVARRDDIRVDEADVDAELDRYAQATGLTVPAVRARLEQDSGLAGLSAGLRREKALAHVMGQLRLVEA